MTELNNTNQNPSSQVGSNPPSTQPIPVQPNFPQQDNVSTASPVSSAPQGAYQTTAPKVVSHVAPAPLNTNAVQQPQKKSTGKTFLAGFAGAAVACVLAFGVSGAYNAVANSGQSAGSQNATGQTVLGGETTATTINIDPGETDTLAEAVAAKCLPSVVAVDVYVDASQLSSMYGISGSSQSGLTKYSLGSGVVLTADGYIITNNHVVEGGSAYKVTIEGEEYDAQLVGADPSSDVAVLKAQNASGLTPMQLGNSDNLTIGEWVMTLGSPFGLEQSVATGIVSATSRSQIMNSETSGEVTYYPNMIQTDAAINPGNSGGALVNSKGELIGINTLITSNSGNYSGVGFAIPVNYAVNLAQQIIDGKELTHAQLGVTVSTIDASTAQRYGFSVNSGAYVTSVAAGSGAEAAGIQEGDIITAFDGQTVSSSSDLTLDVRTKNPGDKVTVTLNRDGQTQEVEVTLGESSQSGSVQQGQNGSNGYGYGYGQGDGSGSGQGDGYGYGLGDGFGFNFGF